MKLDAVIKWFMPREERFHDLLGRDAANLVKAGQLFDEIAKSGDLEERRVKTVQLKALEREGDQITRQIFEALNSTFITPLDREDIRSLAKDLDDVLDSLEMVAQYLLLFELKDAPEALTQFSGILHQMTIEIDRQLGLVWDLANEKRIQESIVRISDLENQGDRLYNAVIAALFKAEGAHPVEILKWKEVYDGLENACDQCKDFTHVVGNVVIKNA